MSWTPERIEKLTELWTKGCSASQIAKELGGITRSSVIGKAHRLGIAHGAQTTPKNLGRAVRQAPSAPRLPVERAVPVLRPAIKKAAPAPTQTPKPTRLFLILGNNAVAENAEPCPIETPGKANAFDALPGSTPRPFWERPAFGCKWPIGEASWSCCLRSETGRYCPEHERMSRGVQPKAKTGNELARSLRRYA